MANRNGVSADTDFAKSPFTAGFLAREALRFLYSISTF